MKITLISLPTFSMFLSVQSVVVGCLNEIESLKMFQFLWFTTTDKDFTIYNSIDYKNSVCLFVCLSCRGKEKEKKKKSNRESFIYWSNTFFPYISGFPRNQAVRVRTLKTQTWNRCAREVFFFSQHFGSKTITQAFIRKREEKGGEWKVTKVVENVTSLTKIYTTPLTFVWASPAQKLRLKSELF